MDEQKNPFGETESDEVSKSVDNVQKIEVVDSTDSTEPVNSVEDTEMPKSDPFETVDPINVPEPTEPIEVVESVDTTIPIEVVETVDVVKPTEDVKLTEEVTPAMETPADKLTKKHNSKPFLVIMLIVALVAISAAGAYFWRDKVANDSMAQKDDIIVSLQVSNKALATQLAAEVAKNALDTDTCTDKTPVATVIDSIKLSITSGNTAALEGYMATSVNVVSGATAAVAGTPAQAVTNITTFISDATSPWNFSLAASALSVYSAGTYGQYFPSTAVVGKSANSKVISFSFDCNGQIDTVFLAASTVSLN